MTTATIKDMSTIERLHAMEELWDALCHEDEEIESPDWHEEILADRNEKMKSGKAEFVTIEALKAGTRK